MIKYFIKGSLFIKNSNYIFKSKNFIIEIPHIQYKY